MNETNLVRFSETVGNLSRDCNRFAKWNGASGEQRPHRLSIHQFHRDIVRTVLVPEFINRNDVRVIQRARRTGLQFETR